LSKGGGEGCPERNETRGAHGIDGGKDRDPLSSEYKEVAFRVSHGRLQSTKKRGSFWGKVTVDIEGRRGKEQLG